MDTAARPRETFRQVAYVTWPDAFDAAVGYWLDTMSAGPFYIGHFRLANQTFRGAPTAGTCTVALTFHGGIQVEIIKPTNDAPSPYTHLLAEAATVPVAGLFHHYLLDTPDFDGTCSRLLATAAVEGMRANLSDGRRMAYLDATSTLGCYIEVIEAAASAVLVAAQMQAECSAWDGTEPLRSYAELVHRALA
jgi:methylmalonyl-CoA/ethylmalonyl-CoA epimerase